MTMSIGKSSNSINRRELLQAGALATAAMGLRSMRAEGTPFLPEIDQAQASEARFTFDATRVPLSRFGSYLTVAYRFWDAGASLQVPNGEYYIRCLQDDPSLPEIFRIEMLKDGSPITPTVESTSGKLTLHHGDATIEFCIAALDQIIVRGTGCTVRLHAITQAYANTIRQSADSWLVMPDPIRSSVQVKRFSGTMQVEAPWVDRLNNVQVDKSVITFAPSDGNSFLCSLLFFEGVPHRDVNQLTFDRAVQAVETEFEEWASRILPLAPRYEPARKLAAYALWSNTVAARGLYTTPVVWGSKSWMARIWSWDHCFCALGLAKSHPDLAWQQFMLFRDMQDPASGMLCDMMSNIQRSWWATKDPVHGWTLGRLLRLAPNGITRKRLQEAYGPLSLWTEFWLKYRDFDGDGLPCIIHPDESFDNTSNNSVGAPAKPPETATYLALQMDTLADVAENLGLGGDAQRWRNQSNRLVQSILRVLWDGQRQRFVSKRVGDGYVAPGDCLLNYMPLLLGDRLPSFMRQSLLNGLKRPGGFVTPFGFSTEALDSPLYNGASYVKGPTWAPLNTLLFEALDEIGETGLAGKVRSAFCDTILAAGMSEHFDAKNGAPRGDPAYIWTAALFLLLATKEAQEGRMFS
jgi:hypothetical protein